MKNLPTFIFFDEDHSSPFTNSLLARLTPRLKQIGYHQFYYEADVKQTLDQKIDSSENFIKVRDAGEVLLPKCRQEILEFVAANQIHGNEKTYDLMRAHFAGIINEIIAKKDESQIIRSFYLSNLLAYLEMEARQNDKSIMSMRVIEYVLSRITLDMLTFGSSIEADLSLMHAIKDNRIAFKGIIDMDQTLNQTANVINNIDDLYAFALNTENLDRQFADAYLRAEFPVFGENGLAHVEGFQRIFSEKFPTEYAKANFVFVYVYQSPLDECNDVAIKFRQELHSGTASLPLGIIEINGENKTEDEIVEEVWARIQGKVSEYQLLPYHLKRFRDDSVVGHVTDLPGSSYRLFGQAVNSVYSTGVDVVERVGAFVRK